MLLYRPPTIIQRYRVPPMTRKVKAQRTERGEMNDICRSILIEDLFCLLCIPVEAKLER